MVVGALWVFTAGCIYAANQQWIGRIGAERAERFVLCLVIALPILLAVVTVGGRRPRALGGQ